MSGCSVSACRLVSPMPWTRLRHPGRQPRLVQISTSSRAVSGVHSAGLWTTVQPAARAGAIFHVDSMNGVFHGVIDADRADRLAHRVVQVGVGGQRQAVVRVRRAVGEEAEVLRAAQRRLAHEAARLAGVHAFDERDLVGARLDQRRRRGAAGGGDPRRPARARPGTRCARPRRPRRPRPRWRWPPCRAGWRRPASSSRRSRRRRAPPARR